MPTAQPSRRFLASRSPSPRCTPPLRRSAAPRRTALVEQAAVLLEHLAKNHPLPDANKRAAFLLTARFLDANGLQWGPPDVETDAGLVERVAASEATHDEVVAWIRGRTREMECPDEKAERPRRLP